MSGVQRDSSAEGLAAAMAAAHAARLGPAVVIPGHAADRVRAALTAAYDVLGRAVAATKEYRLRERMHDARVEIGVALAYLPSAQPPTNHVPAVGETVAGATHQRERGIAEGDPRDPSKSGSGGDGPTRET